MRWYVTKHPSLPLIFLIRWFPSLLFLSLLFLLPLKKESVLRPDSLSGLSADFIFSILSVIADFLVWSPSHARAHFLTTLYYWVIFEQTFYFSKETCKHCCCFLNQFYSLKTYISLSMYLDSVHSQFHCGKSLFFIFPPTVVNSKYPITKWSSIARFNKQNMKYSITFEYQVNIK